MYLKRYLYTAKLHESIKTLIYSRETKKMNKMYLYLLFMGKPTSLLLLITNFLGISSSNALPHLLQRPRIGRDDTAIPAVFGLFVLDICDGPLGRNDVFMSEDEYLLDNGRLAGKRNGRFGAE